MRKVEFLDTTLRDGEQTPGVNFSVKEKVAIAKQLEKWGIASIEAGFPAASPDSFEAVRQIAEAMTTTAVSGLARSVKADIDACYEALKDAKYPQCHVFIATSPIHREYKLKKTKEEILDIIKEHVTYARSKFDVVEFSPEDATRTELDYLLQVVQTAVDAGATYINIPDTVGFTTPEEFGHIFKYLIENVTSDREIIFSPHCHDDLGMATANTLAAIKNGAGRIEGTVNGIGERAGNVALEEVAVALNIREDYYQATSDIVLNETVNTSELISRFSGIPIPKNKAVIGGNAFSHESGIHQDGVLKNPLTYEIITPELVGVKHNSLPLGKLSGRHAFVEKLKELEIAFEEAEIKPLFGKFKKLADKKTEITDADILALVAGTEIENPEGFHFGDLKFTSNPDETVTAEVTMINAEDEEVDVTADGKGSVEAVYNAIDKFFNQKVRLLSYTMDAVTDGIDSQARVSVSVENDDTGTIFNASGIDFDVLKAGAIAYVNANALVQKENAGEIGKAVSYRDVPTND
ncbi:2-isopropylmalate synthase [Streptococcus infantarius subsp. infantarius]|uniref:2-isopropylmalate synthase n=1 Tax=Streptococcus TaxID=1301 RepID=UPI000EECE4CB|nr:MULTISPECIES: 2-isopropylmalate synthase [Streptococcus]MBT0895961.1 2-isopropylmalate synthase [Streptococcus infantarius subsp. infantarius]MBT0900201.1 2-isopropylmalate synthase [Streptococcus infantarius subsp. infantarius]MBT1033838.1 2-isopropylmalate synthase [Streptococcus infantarius subsp. infantarius]MCO4481620.1 2-isopropylmalate synthase [Streptococcus infantarius subsp. infantarius]MCO4488845.1 2-isopropylmalate synthase [Streptococcus infantarius subsp. infantarius]